MPTTVKGQADLSRFIATLPAAMERGVLRGAMKAFATVIAEDAKERCDDPAVAASISVGVTSQPGLVTGTIKTVGPGAYRAPWAEFGTKPHLIAVNEAERAGRTLNRINRLVREGSLVIGNHFVGPVVQHPGARERPFLRPAADTKAEAGVDAAIAYIAARSSSAGLTAVVSDDDGEA